MNNIVCISHSEDVDGLVCASLIKMAKNASYILSGYPDLAHKLKSIKGKVDMLYVCDLSLDSQIVSELRRIRKFSEVVCIDHHPVKEGILRDLEAMGVNLIHSTEKCAAALAYDLLKQQLPDDASILTSYATLSDYPYAGQYSRLYNEGTDHHLMRFESELLFYSVARASEDNEFKNDVVNGLSRLKYPHEIERVFEFSKQEVEYIVDLARNIDAEASFCDNLAYVKVIGNTGVVANALVHLVGKRALICYKVREKGESCYLSIRTKENGYDLGAMASDVAEKVGGMGGGHPLAAAARLPTKSFSEFITLMNNAFAA